MSDILTKSFREPGKPPELPPLIKTEMDDPFYLEQIKALRSKFEYNVDARKIQAVAVTSAIAGEGKTLSCANLAANLAMGGRKRILLIDADIRKSDLARGMNVAPLPGLSNYLTGTVSAPEIAQIARNSFLPGFTIIPAGARHHAPGDLLTGERFRSLLTAMRKRFDVILIDTPPVLPAADTLALKDQVDGFLFVFRMEFTPYPMLRQAIDEVGEEKVIGVVLNGVAPRSQKYYQRYYGKYYRKPSA